ncbi:MAG: metalloregulator ArsR/SmtB family transcription factor [Acidobacteriota bacterium]
MGDSSLADLEEFFLALSDGTRLRLLNLMRLGEVSVGYLSDELRQSQPKISRHLAYLRSAGLVETRRDGKWIYYRISRSSDFAMQALNVAMDWVDQLSGRTTESRSSARKIAIRQPVQIVDRVHEENEPYSNEIEIYLL